MKKTIILSLLITSFGFSQEFSSGLSSNFKSVSTGLQETKTYKKKKQYYGHGFSKKKQDYLYQLNNIENCILLAENKYEIEKCERDLKYLYKNMQRR